MADMVFVNFFLQKQTFDQQKFTRKYIIYELKNKLKWKLNVYAPSLEEIIMIWVLGLPDPAILNLSWFPES